MNLENVPYALSSCAERERRSEMLLQSHVAPLTDYVATLRGEHPGHAVPEFDPCDGGVQARVLFLLQAPGKKALESNFISRNNPDPTAKNLGELLDEAGIARRDTVLWNLVPWSVEQADSTMRFSHHVAQARPYTQALLGLLTNLEYIVLMGVKAQLAKNDLRAYTEVPFVDVALPTKQVFNVWPQKRDEMRQQLRELADWLL